MSLYTVFDETFTGTAGAAITGSAGSPVASGVDTWVAVSTLPAMVYAAGGGASRAGSWARICSCRRLSSGPGSTPICSISAARASW